MNLTDRLITEIVGKCDGLSITAEQASNILAYLQCGAPLDTTTNTGAASDERTKFNAWLEKRGVWPRLTYFEIWQAALATTTPQADAAPRFSITYCSQCGQEFGPGNSGFSHCRNHQSGALDAAPMVDGLPQEAGACLKQRVQIGSTVYEKGVEARIVIEAITK